MLLNNQLLVIRRNKNAKGVKLRDTISAPVSHNEIELQFVLSGKCSYFVNDKLFHLEKNDLLLVRENEQHLWVFTSPVMEKICVMFSPGLLDSAPAWLKSIRNIFTSSKDQVDKITISKSGDTEIILVLRKIAAIYENNNARNPENILGPFYYLLFLVQENYNDSKNKIQNYDSESNKFSFMTQLLGWIDERFLEEINLDSLAEKAGLSPNYVSGAFKKITGRTFKEILISKRISYARGLLETESGKSILSIALRSGFSDISNFNKMFFKHTGLAPKNYRKIHILNRKKDQDRK